MEAGIQVRRVPNLISITQAGFSCREISYEQMISEAHRQEKGSFGIQAAGVFVTAAMAEQKLADTLERAAALRLEYAVVETEGLLSFDGLRKVLADGIEEIKKFQIPVYIENNSSYDCMADSDEMITVIEELNTRAGEECFGICFNTGHANLLGKNISAMIGELNHKIKLVHINDNDGFHDSHQMPYTFTTGRGTPSTAWSSIIGALIKIHYRGRLVFDTHGLFSHTPQPLQVSMLSLLRALAGEWERQMTFERLLAQKKQIILFGAGNMCRNYRMAWGEKYPPAFVVDNNSKLWGELREGIKIKPPEAILEIPEENRNVLICNIYYRQIEAQLEHMGIKAVWYEEQYFM